MPTWSVSHQSTSGKVLEHTERNGNCGTSVYLLDIVAVTRSAAADPALPTVIAANSVTPLNTDSRLYSRCRVIEGGIITMDADEVTTQVVLATE